jgi:hypothetical protein
VYWHEADISPVAELATFRLINSDYKVTQLHTTIFLVFVLHLVLLDKDYL